MDEQDYAATNGRFWERRCASHLARWYDVEAFRAGGSTLDPLQLAEVGDVCGKRLLHLQCNAGLDSLSWSRLGARVTGIDIAPGPLDVGRQLAQEFDLPVTFVECDVYAVPEALEDKYDVVYTSQGVLCWLRDLGEWARVVAEMLAPHGFFYIMEEHPYAVMLDDTEIRPAPDEPYFRVEDAQYDERDATYQWTYSLSDVVNALLTSGLRLEFLNEHDRTFYQRLPYMERVDEHWWTIPGFSIPLMFTLGARKPE